MSDLLRLITEARERAEKAWRARRFTDASCFSDLASELERHANITEAAERWRTRKQDSSDPDDWISRESDLCAALAAAREEQPT